ncbi:unnamed protein product, partial [Taenia asiatica]|uniref:C2H2-type domain-containing protein n=1 Tax=Taenia asiatica TaxID=60517 RepID=A0A158RA08_TAEAS
REFPRDRFTYPFLSEKSVSFETLPLSSNSTQDFGNCSTPAFHSSESCSRTDSPNIGDSSHIFQMLEVSSSPDEVTSNETSRCPSRPLEWDYEWNNGDKANEDSIHPQSKDLAVQLETSIDSIWTWPTCQRACVSLSHSDFKIAGTCKVRGHVLTHQHYTPLRSPPVLDPYLMKRYLNPLRKPLHVSVPVIIDRPARERQPTPPPSPLPLPTASQVYSYRKKTPVPQFLHPTELIHDYGKLQAVQCNNHSLSSSRVDLSTRELCEAVTRAEMWTQRSMKGLREHARSLLAATEEEERRLRARLASLQSQMMMAVETERSGESSEATSISDNPAVERRKGDLRPQIDEVTTNVDFNTSAAAPLFDRHRCANVYATNERFFAKKDLSSTPIASPDPGNAGDIDVKEPTAVGEGDASPDHPSPPNCCSTPLRDDKLSDNTDHSNFQHLYHHSDLPEQKQEEHQSQSDDIVTLIAEETSDHREHGGHASIEPQVLTNVSDNQSEVDDATYHFEGVREQLTTSEVDNFCQDKGKEGVPSLPTHSEEVGGGDGLPCKKVNKQDIRPEDALDQAIGNRDISLQSVPAVGGVSSKVQDFPPKNSVVSESSLTEVSSSVEAIVNEFGRFSVETGEAVKQRFLELFKEESKKLKVAKAAYLSKKQTIRELKMLFKQGLSLSESVS